MALKTWLLTLALFLIAAISGIVNGEQTVNPDLKLNIPTTDENAMSTISMYNDDDGGSDFPLQGRVVTGPAGINGPTIEDKLRAPTIEDKLKSGELQNSPTYASQPGSGLDAKGNFYYPNDYIKFSSGGQSDDSFKIYVIGDSIAWGNGLERENTYYYQVAKNLYESLNMPVEVIVYAHSGAVISKATPGDPLNPQKDANLNSGYPTLMDQAEHISEDADLVLVSGGINDVGIMNILDVNKPIDDIRDRSADIQKPMTELLTNLLDKTDAKIIVTGYYPIVSRETNIEPQDRLVTNTAQVTSDKPIDKVAQKTIEYSVDKTAILKDATTVVKNNIDETNRRADNSDAFYIASKTSLNNAVTAVDKGASRVVFVDPTLQSKDSYGASQSSLWELNPQTSIFDFTSNDDRFKERSNKIAQNSENPITDLENRINAIGHPNEKGASQYAKAITETIDKITEEDPDWLFAQPQKRTIKPNQLSGSKFPTDWQQPGTEKSSALESWGKHPKGWGVSQAYVNAHPEIYGYPSPTPSSPQSGSNSGSSGSPGGLTPEQIQAIQEWLDSGAGQPYEPPAEETNPVYAPPQL